MIRCLPWWSRAPPTSRRVWCGSMMLEDFVLRRRKIKKTKRTRMKMIWTSLRTMMAVMILIKIKMEKRTEKTGTGMMMMGKMTITARTCPALGLELLLRTTKWREEMTMRMPAMAVGRISVTRKMSEYSLGKRKMPEEKLKTNHEEKCLSYVNFQLEAADLHLHYNVSCV